MAPQQDGHFEPGPEDRKGYYQKNGDNDGVDYETEFDAGSSGYSGPKHEIHHIVPAVAIEQSLLAIKDDDKRSYLQVVKHITDYNINWNFNLIGLPHLIAYEAAAQVAAKGSYWGGWLRVAGLPSKIKALVVNYNNPTQQSGMTGAEKRSEHEEDFKAGKGPRDWPIHQPTNWGHKGYDKKLTKQVKEQVWDPLNEKRKNHELDAEKVSDALLSLADQSRAYLTRRGKGAGVERWLKREDEYGSNWWKPFTMHPCRKPL